MFTRPANITSLYLIIGLTYLVYLGTQAGGPNTILNLNENQGGVFDDLLELTMNLPINILILMESHQENEILFVCDCLPVQGRWTGLGGESCSQLLSVSDV